MNEEMERKTQAPAAGKRSDAMDNQALMEGLAGRLQTLRKSQGLTQEQLADLLGISRQAVSKWESAQSLPETDKLLALAQQLGVSTDYLLTGRQDTPAPAATPQPDPRDFTVVATVVDLIGVAAGCALWHEWQNALCLLAGVVLLAAGCMIYALGLGTLPAAQRPAAKRRFWRLNIWLVPFMPLAFAVNLLCNDLAAPYPISFAPGIRFWPVYLALGTVVTLLCRKTD